MAAAVTTAAEEQWERLFRAFYFSNIEFDPRATLSSTLLNDTRYDRSAMSRARAAMRMLELCQMGHGKCVAVRAFANKPIELHALGFHQSASGSSNAAAKQEWELDAALLARLEKSKASMRRLFHSVNTAVRYESFAQIVRAEQRVSGVIPSQRNAISLRTAYDRVFEFARLAKGKPQLAPLVASVHELVRVQCANADHCVAWTVADAELVERATPEEVDALVTALIIAFGCEASLVTADELGGTASGTSGQGAERASGREHRWMMHQGMSDQQAAYLVMALPTGPAKIVGSVGVESTSSARTNAGGAEDVCTPPHWVIQSVRNACVIL
jgi:hypothetical protein